jgi:hypothetical protein
VVAQHAVLLRAEALDRGPRLAVVPVRAESTAIASHASNACPSSSRFAAVLTAVRCTVGDSQV